MENLLHNEEVLLKAINEIVVVEYKEEGLELDCLDIYYEPKYNNLRVEVRGMDYSGDDKEASLVARIDDEEVFVEHYFE